MPVWHASFAIKQWKSGIVPPQRWSLKHWQWARSRLSLLLGGVGTNPVRQDVTGACVHWRRALHPEEIAQLDTEWCKLPAVDMAGGSPDHTFFDKMDCGIGVLP